MRTHTLFFSCLLLLATVTDTVEAASSSFPKARGRENSQTITSQTSTSTNPRLEALYQQYYGRQANCNPSRQSVLASPRYAIRPLGQRLHTSQVERTQLQREHLVLANYKHYQEREAKRSSNLKDSPASRPRDPYLDNLAKDWAIRNGVARNTDR